jgi:hypothetical protein
MAQSSRTFCLICCPDVASLLAICRVANLITGSRVTARHLTILEALTCGFRLLAWLNCALISGGGCVVPTHVHTAKARPETTKMQVKGSSLRESCSPVLEPRTSRSPSDLRTNLTKLGLPATPVLGADSHAKASLHYLLEMRSGGLMGRYESFPISKWVPGGQLATAQLIAPSWHRAAIAN